MSLGTRIALAGLVLAAALASGLVLGMKWEQGQQAIRDQARAEQTAREQIRRAERHDQAAVRYEADRERIRVEYVTVTEEIDRVVEKPFYSDLCLDADGLRNAQRAIGGGPAPGQPAPAVPAAPAAAD